MIIVDGVAENGNGWKGKFVIGYDCCPIVIHESNKTSIYELLGKVVTFRRLLKYRLHPKAHGSWVEIWVDSLTEA